jgi:hypothetical protein
MKSWLLAQRKNHNARLVAPKTLRNSCLLLRHCPDPPDTTFLDLEIRHVAGLPPVKPVVRALAVVAGNNRLQVSVRRRHKPAENAAQSKKGHLWMETI